VVGVILVKALERVWYAHRVSAQGR